MRCLLSWTFFRCFHKSIFEILNCTLPIIVSANFTYTNEKLIRIVVDEENLIEEFDETNNIGEKDLDKGVERKSEVSSFEMNLVGILLISLIVGVLRRKFIFLIILSN